MPDTLAFGITRRAVNWVLDADIRAFFDSISHEWMMRFLEHRIGDRRVLRLAQTETAASTKSACRRGGPYPRRGCAKQPDCPISARRDAVDGCE